MRPASCHRDVIPLPLSTYAPSGILFSTKGSLACTRCTFGHWNTEYSSALFFISLSFMQGRKDAHHNEYCFCQEISLSPGSGLPSIRSPVDWPNDLLAW